MSEELLGTYKRELSDAKREIEDLKKALDKREDDNKGYRDTLKERDARIAELEKVAPPEGSVILKPADAERWQQYQELGKVDEVKAALESKGTAEEQLTELRRRETIREAGYNSRKLERLLNGTTFAAQGEGDERVYGVLTKQEDGSEKFIPLEGWAEAEGISDLLNMARLEPQGVPFVMDQAGRRTPPPPTDIARAERDKAFS